MKTIQLLLLIFISVMLIIGTTGMSSSSSSIEADPTTTTEKAPPAQTLPLSQDEFQRPGSTSFSVSGLEPNEPVEVVITNPNGEQKRYESKADSNGNFSGTINVEENDPLGRYTVSIYGLSGQKSWHGGFTVTAAPTTTTETTLPQPPIPSDTEMYAQLDKSIQNLQNQVNSIENQIKTYKMDPRLVNWIIWWWWIGFIIGWLWFFVWLFFGWQCWNLKFWVFVFPRPWWFFLPLIWFVPWIVWGIVNWLVWWQPWVWVWWIFPWAFWLPWWIIIFKEKEIWLWRKI